jgi:hypothetical protein
VFLFNARGAGCDIFCVSTDCLQSLDNLASCQSEERILSFVRRNCQVSPCVLASIT